MAQKKGLSPSVSSDALQKLLQSGITSPFLSARIQHAEAATLLSHHLRPMAGATRVYPTMVIPQASGRVGISDPPLGNFTADRRYGPRGLRDVIRPDPGTKWIEADLNAAEMEIVCHRARDPTNEEVRRRHLDRHTVNAIRVLRYRDPPADPTKEWLGSEAGLAWREEMGFDLRTRVLIKSCQFCLQYSHGGPTGQGAERAMARYATELQMSKEALWAIGRTFLQERPWLTAWKRQRWAEAWRKKEARTAFGRRRRLLGDRMNVEKEGLNHEVQGTVADIMKMTMVALAEGIPGARMVLQRHDGFYTEVPAAWDDMPTYRAIVEREWTIDNRPISFGAEYEEWHA